MNIKSKKLLAIMGSPRADGNIAKMFNHAVAYAKSAGWSVDTIYLYDKSITWCKGCMSCKKTGVCVIEDDITSIRKLLIDCDVVLLAAPTYFANVPAIVKNMFDRLVGAVMDDNSSSIPKPKLSNQQKYLLMTTCNTPAPFSYLSGQSRGTLHAMKEFFHISGMRKMGNIVFSGTRNKSTLPRKIQSSIEKYW